MAEIPKCNGELATLRVYIEPNEPQPGSYTVHFLQPDVEGIGFNAGRVCDLPRLLNHINTLAAVEGFAGICREEGDLYVESTVAIDSQMHLSATSHEVNLYQMFKDAESKPMQLVSATVSMKSMVPQAWESVGIALHKRRKYRHAQAVFDDAIQKGQVTTAAGWYYAGLSTLKAIKYGLFAMGKHDLAPDEPIDPPTFRRIVMLFGAATAFSKAERLAVDDDDPIYNLANERKFEALNALDKLGQIDDPRLRGLERNMSPRPFAPETLPEDDRPPMHPGELRERIADMEMRLGEEPDNPEILIRLALQISDAGKFREAIDLAEKAVEVSDKEDRDKRIVYLESLVEIYKQAGNEYIKGRIRALERLVKATVTKRQTNYAWKELAELYIKVGTLGKAQEAAGHAVTQAQGMVKRAERQYKDPDSRKKRFAVFSLRKANSELAIAQNFLGDVLMARYEKNPQTKRARDYLDHASRAYIEALKSDPWNLDYMLGWAHAQHKLGNSKEAIRIAQVAIHPKMKGDRAKATKLLDEIILSHKHPRKARKALEKQLSAKDLVAYGMTKLKTVAVRLTQPLAEAIQVFRSAIEFYPKDFEARYRLGMTLYNVSMEPAQRDDPAYKEEGLAALTKAMDLLSKDVDRELEAQGIISDNAYVEVLVALVTLAAELNRSKIATKYLESAENLDKVKLKSQLPLDTIYERRSTHVRELEALDRLSHLAAEDERIERRLAILRWILLGGLESKSSESPKADDNPGAPPAPSSNPGATGNSPTPSGTPNGGTAATRGGYPATSLGSFDIDPDELPQSRTPYRSPVAIRRRRNRARSNSHDPGNMVYGSGMSTFGARPAGQTTTGVQIPVWLFRPVGK